jgi:hypothetical protein
MKIPFNQVLFENVNFGCLDNCGSSNEEKLQAIVDKVCVDYTKVNLTCLGESKKELEIDILNLIVSELCKLKTQVNGGSTNNNGSNQTNTTSIDISKITLCGRDNTAYDYQDCLQVLTTCFPNLTIEAIISAIIKRLNSNSFWINQLHIQYNQQSQKINYLETKLLQIENKLNGCCP